MELKGRGCRQFESYLLAQQRSWYEFFMDVLVAGGVMKRLDLAINDKTGILNIPVLTEKCQQEECISVFRSFKSYRSGELVRKEEKECMGNTSISVHYKVKFISVSMKRTTSSTRKMIFPLKTQK